MTTIDEEFSSDSNDEDYVPGVEEVVSEDDQSGEDEELLHAELSDGSKTNKIKGKKKRSKASVLTVRKRKGGIKLEEEVEDETTKQDDEAADSKDTQLSEEMQREAEERKELTKKKRVDDLWADFLKDTSSPLSQPKPKSSPLNTQAKSATTTQIKGVTSTVCQTASNSNNTLSKKPAKVTITQEFDFAGEIVKITKEVDVNSKEAKQMDQKDVSNLEGKASPAALSGAKRPGGGLGNLLGKLGKKPKISTLEKSQLDWNKFKQEEGLEEELQVHNRGKEGYLERQAFLSRTDHRQYELEKSVRLGLSKR